MQFPFDKVLFDKAFWIAILVAIIGWVMIYLIWGEFTPSDIIGMIVAVPILAYLIQVLMMFNKN
ncbi:MAG: hypothetical protein ABI851_07445 [Saprospiraceae bacterium]